MLCNKCGKEINNRQLVCKDCKNQLVRRGDVFLCKTERGIAQVLVLQNDVGNYHSPVTIGIKLTKGKANYYQVQTLDKSRLIKKINRFDEEQMKNIVLNLRKVLIG